jgi:hypothetical protein
MVFGLGSNIELKKVTTSEHLFIARKLAIQIRAVYFYQEVVSIKNYDDAFKMWTSVKSKEFGEAFAEEYEKFVLPFCTSKCGSRCAWDENKGSEKRLGCPFVGKDFIRHLVDF